MFVRYVLSYYGDCYCMLNQEMERVSDTQNVILDLRGIYFHALELNQSDPSPITYFTLSLFTYNFIIVSLLSMISTFLWL